MNEKKSARCFLWNKKFELEPEPKSESKSELRKKKFYVGWSFDFEPGISN